MSDDQPIDSREVSGSYCCAGGPGAVVRDSDSHLPAKKDSAGGDFFLSYPSTRQAGSGEEDEESIEKEVATPDSPLEAGRTSFINCS